MPVIDEKGLNQIVSPGVGGSNILSGISESIKNFKDVLELIGKLRGMNVNQGASEMKALVPTGEQKGINQFLSMIQALGLADIPIQKILEEIGPYTISQLRGMGGKIAQSGK